MERRGQEREIGMANSNISYGSPPPQMVIQESPVKLPLAPILSTPPERRASLSMLSTRRGSSIFSPTQTLDHHHHHHYIPPPPPPQHHPLQQQQLSPPAPPPPVLQQPLVDEDSSPDPDPPPTFTPATAAAASNSNNPAPPPPPLPPLPAAGSIRYRECLKNHAVNMGGHVVDGCGEFMPSGDDGTPESLRCAACDCHRNFHRKEAEGQPPPQTPHHAYVTPNSGNNNNNNSSNSHRAPQLFHGGGQVPSSAPPPHNHHHHHNLKRSHSYSQAFASGGPTPPTMVNFGGNSGGAAAESSSEDLNMFQSSGGGHAAGTPPSYLGSKKRFRTKFSQNQKSRMHEFASRIGWRMQKQDEKEVQQFCNEVGVKRQVFKVWMHNNKQATKKTPSD